ncbi:LysR family transcriptional regulator [Streptomyces violaceus]|uniref:LysR substrate-binding domain-containing protein n=1 Tax=Streptomyces violaceus TaxID=1936 RepID=A0ABY9U739_STRVL|nr:LysR substrate-binding domain-containing protein [Streptomyces janthinus]WND16146.1 LysR substrate-binding domain-containing protein [Streptomyces janthinus]GGS90789.1 putative transcriptional regulator, LysR family protein [Streptomyces janthinus]
MRPVLDIVALRSLIAVADYGGFHRAAAELALSQSAVSQHVRRLEKSLGHPVVERDGRKTRFTALGAQLLEEARLILGAHDAAVQRLLGEEGVTAATVVIGATEHGADQILPALTDAVREVRPDAEVRVRIDRSARLTEAVGRGELDLAVYVTEATTTEGTSVGDLPLRWYAAPGWQPPATGQLPLVAVNAPCVIRRRALTELAARRMPATVVAEAGYLAGVLDAARAGLGAALLAVPGGQHPDGLVPYRGLPGVPPVRLSALARRGSDPSLTGAAVQAVRALLASRATDRAA